MKKKKLGEMLVEAGLLNEEQLNSALADQKNTNLKLGQFLTRQGIISERRIMDLVAQQLKIDQYSSEAYPVDLNMAQLLPVEIAQKFQVAPLRKKGYLLTVAMVDPMDITAMDKVEVLTNLEVEPVICTEQELNTLISSLYGMYSDLDGVLESVDMEVYGADQEGTGGKAEELDRPSLQDLAEEAPVVRLVNSILTQAVREGASDIHFTPEKDYVFLQFRIDGRLQNVPSPSKPMFLPIVSRIKILANMDIASARIPQDGRFTVKMENREINIRVSTMPTTYGENLVLRLLDMSSGFYSLELLGMSATDMKKIRAMIVKPYGMILSTGPTGSGKSSSIYSILKEIYRPELNIITLEDPVEYRMERIRQVQLNRKAGMTFASGLRSVLRQDPDVVMVGEIRDAETATIAIQAALTGHLVLSTVHTNNAAGAITRLLDMGIEPYLVVSVLLMSFAQRLVRKICPHCREPFDPPAAVRAGWGLDTIEEKTLMHGRGCFHCKDTGYRGRTGIFETLIVDEMVQEMTLKHASAREITRAAKKTGRLSELRDDALAKVCKGITTLEEAALAVMI
ncbi:MAG: GspE/PulE family protein [Desulfobacterales bacterium]|nr:GspE/PulE family protein [Desulfobacterales bacterium]